MAGSHALQREHGTLERFNHPVLGPMVLLARVTRINHSRDKPQGPPALLDEHTDSVMRNVGYSEAEVRALRASGVISQPTNS